jgi:Fic family protein
MDDKLAMQTEPQSRAGRFVLQHSGPDGYAAFVPAPLPPKPPVEFGPELRHASEDAAHALGRLDGASALLDPDRLLYMYVRKEAVLSSQIEGTQSTLSDLLTYENEQAPGTPVTDVLEVSHYVAALQHAAESIQSGRLPLTLRLLRETHAVLMRDGRGARQAAGEFRRTQNWIGGSRPGNAKFVPPPPHEMQIALDNFERYLHDEYGRTPPILKAGIAHAQFETIHPFLDGNGRIGRLLISLLFVADGVLRRPFFYLSLYLKENRADYYDALQRVRTHGDWEGWLHFYLVGVEAVARQATQTTQALSTLFQEDEARVRLVGRSAGTALRVYDALRRRVIVSTTRLTQDLDLTWPAIQRAMERLEALGIAREITGRARGRMYAYDRQLELLNRGVNNEPERTGVLPLDRG